MSVSFDVEEPIKPGECLCLAWLWRSIVFYVMPTRFRWSNHHFSPPPAGHIPAELGLLTVLEELILSNNELTGESIPFHKFSELMYFLVRSNSERSMRLAG